MHVVRYNNVLTCKALFAITTINMTIDELLNEVHPLSSAFLEPCTCAQWTHLPTSEVPGPAIVQACKVMSCHWNLEDDERLTVLAQSVGVLHM